MTVTTVDISIVTAQTLYHRYKPDKETNTLTHSVDVSE